MSGKLKQSFEIVVNQIDLVNQRIDELPTGGGGGGVYYITLQEFTKGDSYNEISAPSMPGDFHTFYMPNIPIIVPPKTKMVMCSTYITVKLNESVADGGAGGKIRYNVSEDSDRFSFGSFEFSFIGTSTRTASKNVDYSDMLGREPVMFNNTTDNFRYMEFRNSISNYYTEPLRFGEFAGVDDENTGFYVTHLIKMEPLP